MFYIIISNSSRKCIYYIQDGSISDNSTEAVVVFLTTIIMITVEYKQSQLWRRQQYITEDLLNQPLEMHLITDVMVGRLQWHNPFIKVNQDNLLFVPITKSFKTSYSTTFSHKSFKLGTRINVLVFNIHITYYTITTELLNHKVTIFLVP